MNANQTMMTMMTDGGMAIMSRYNWKSYWNIYDCPYTEGYKCESEPNEEKCNGCNYKALGEGRYDDVKFPPREEE